MSIDSIKIASLLGSQTRFFASKTSNVHQRTQTVLDSSHIQMYTQKEGWANAKIDAKSAPEGYVWVVIDYDDHQNIGKLTDIKHLFDLKPTLTVATPKGGKHEWYLTKEDNVKGLSKWKYRIPSIENVEFLIGHKNIEADNTFVAPGSTKKEGVYSIVNGIKPALLSNNLIETLLVQVRAQSQDTITRLEMNKEAFQSEIDASHNKQKYFNYINKVCEPYAIGDKELEYEGGRNDFIFGHFAEGFTFNISINQVRNIAVEKLQNLFIDRLNEEEVENTLKSAQEYIITEKRNNQKSVDIAIEEFEEDGFGNRIVTREALTEKVLRLNKYRENKINADPILRRIQCELIVYGRNTDRYYVPKIMSYGRYEKIFTNQIEKESKSINLIELDRILSLRSKTKLHWQEVKEDQLKRMYRYSTGKRLKPIISWGEWNNHFACTVQTSADDESIVIEEDEFFLVEHGPFDIVDDVKPEERKQVIDLISRHLSRIVDTENFREEASWILDRYAKLLQNLDDRIESNMILQGSQGSGKTSFIIIMMAMFPASKTNFYYDIERIAEKFFTAAHACHFDDVNLNRNDKVINVLKAFMTTSKIEKEIKFENRELVHGSFNPSITTNDEITDQEILTGRRNTVLVNYNIVSIEKIKNEVRDTFIKLKANDFRLYNVLYTLLMNRDVSKFKSNYKSAKQKEMIMHLNKGGDFTIALANMIANYGYVSNSCQVAKEGELLNKNDFNAALMKHWLLLDTDKENVGSPKLLRELEGYRLTHHLHDDKHKNKAIRAEFKEIFTAPENTKSPSVINNSIHTTNAYITPSIKGWIKLLTIIYMNDYDEDCINHIVKKFGFENQWKWDNKTKPEVMNLGRINIYDTIEFEFEDNEEEF